MVRSGYVVSVRDHADLIIQFIEEFIQFSTQNAGFCVLKDQLRTLEGKREETEYVDESKIKVYTLEDTPSFSHFTSAALQGMSFVSLTPEQLRQPMNLKRQVIQVTPETISKKKLTLKFVSVDTDELQGTEISYSGAEGCFKVGEGDLNHYQILNDKKLWESQFMLVCKDGAFYIRDLGVVHTSRVKVDKGVEV